MYRNAINFTQRKRAQLYLVTNSSKKCVASTPFSIGIASEANTPHNKSSRRLRPRGAMFFRTIEQVRRFFRILAGFTLLLVGVIMFFTPGPGWIIVFLGLTLLAAEFVWAKRLMDRMKHEGNRLKDTVLKVSRN
jgi:Flp pilus assembly protein TadB